jgi:hypothetical protein
MNAKDELHALVDGLTDARAAKLLAWFQLIADKEMPMFGSELVRPRDRTRPPVVSGHDFFRSPPKGLATLAAEQGVQPVTDFDNLLGDFWPEDETADDFIVAVRSWRREGGHA